MKMPKKWNESLGTSRLCWETTWPHGKSRPRESLPPSPVHARGWQGVVPCRPFSGSESEDLCVRGQCSRALHTYSLSPKEKSLPRCLDHPSKRHCTAKPWSRHCGHLGNVVAACWRCFQRERHFAHLHDLNLWSTEQSDQVRSTGGNYLKECCLLSAVLSGMPLQYKVWYFSYCTAVWITGLWVFTL